MADIAVGGYGLVKDETLKVEAEDCGYLKDGTPRFMTWENIKVDGFPRENIQGFDIVANVGDVVQTLGYFSSGDGGDNLYEIVAAGTGTDDGGTFINLAGSGHQAKGLFPGGTVNVRQFGAVGNGVADDTAAVQATID